MHSFTELSAQFAEYFKRRHFPDKPATLYEADNYFLSLGGKRIRPVMCLMGNELFTNIKEDAWPAATAIELFHNFTLIHDDIMDAASLRRGMQTVHYKYGSSTALLAGDVMFVVAYQYLNQLSISYLQRINDIFSKTAKQVCEGQQIDMDFEKMQTVSMPDYLEMIELKTSVLLAASLQMGGIIAGANDSDLFHLYEFGRNLGIAFQVQDDYLDAFGDPKKFGKDVGGDIRQNKKTFLLIHALETGAEKIKAELLQLIKANPEDKVQRVLSIFRDCNIGEWAMQLKQDYYKRSLDHLNAIAVTEERKQPLRELAAYLLERDF